MTVIAAGVTTCSVFVALTLYVWLTPKGFDVRWACGIVLLAALVGFGLILGFLTHAVFSAVLCALEALVVGLYLTCAILVVVDKNGMNCDDYIFGSVMIYAVSATQVLIVLFIYVLAIVASLRAGGM